MIEDYAVARKKMVEYDIIRRGIKDELILNAMRMIPRHLFVPEEYQDIAYSDRPLPIGFEQTISQPYIVALMVSMLDICSQDTVLEIGTGCGYQSAILSLLCKNVFSIEIIPELAKKAKSILSELELKNVIIKIGDGNEGWNENSPYDGIIISAAARIIPRTLLRQLKNGGNLVAPVGFPGFQLLEKWSRQGSNYTKETGIPVSFVPLVESKRPKSEKKLNSR